MAIPLKGTYAATVILPDKRICLKGVVCDIPVDEPIVNLDDFDDACGAFVFLLKRPATIRGEKVEGCKQLVMLSPATRPLGPSIDPREVEETPEFIDWRRKTNAANNGIGKPPTSPPALYLRGAINPG